MIIIFSSERSLLQQGHKVGELVFPLARSFSMSMDVESVNRAKVQIQNHCVLIIFIHQILETVSRLDL